MTEWNFARCCSEILTQTALLRSTVDGATKDDLARPVPSCPGWNVGQLLRHLGGAQRWIEEAVRTRATEAPPQEQVRVLDAYTEEDPAVVGPWLTEGAELLVANLREAGPDARVWVPLPSAVPSPMFHARRMVHETVIHRADAVLALGQRYTVDTEVALDSVDEWMDLGTLPVLLELYPAKRELLGPGRTVHLHATDTPAEAVAEWVLDLTGSRFTWRRAHEKCAVAVRGPLTDLLLLIYRRLAVTESGVEVLGDRELLDRWLATSAFG